MQHALKETTLVPPPTGMYLMYVRRPWARGNVTDGRPVIPARAALRRRRPEGNERYVEQSTTRPSWNDDFAPYNAPTRYGLAGKGVRGDRWRKHAICRGRPEGIGVMTKRDSSLARTAKESQKFPHLECRSGIESGDLQL